MLPHRLALAAEKFRAPSYFGIMRIAINALASSSGVAPSTVYSMLNAKSQNPGVVSLQKLCDGLGISLREFFDDDLFDNIEQEIK